MEIRVRIEKETEVVQWYEAKGMDKEPELAAVRRMGVVGEDGVHLSEELCRSYCRESVFQGGGGRCDAGGEQ